MGDKIRWCKTNGKQALKKSKQRQEINMALWLETICKICFKKFKYYSTMPDEKPPYYCKTCREKRNKTK